MRGFENYFVSAAFDAGAFVSVPKSIEAELMQ